MKRFLSLFLGFLCMPFMAPGIIQAKSDKHTQSIPEMRWDWEKEDVTNVSFPKDFLWGAAICEFQTSGAEGCPDSQWAHWEHAQKLQPSRKVCDSWNTYQKDIKILKELGLTCYRFSIDWSKIEPRQGQIDQSALDHYVEMCDALRAAGIKPVVTLHHFVHPQWFEELGGFEKKENTKYFVEFSKLVFTTLGERVGLWATFNEPAVYVMQGYVRGVYPPGKSGYFGVKTASKVLRNVLDAHVEVYYALKALPGGEKAQIGIVHQYLKFEPFSGKGFSNKLEKLIASQFDWVHKTVIEYFKTGTYHFYVPAICDVQDASNQERRKASLDYIGLNYYSHPLIRVHHRLKDPIYPGQREYDIKTGMPFNVYAEGFYNAIKHVAELGKPIYITENGAPSSDNEVKDIWSKRYLYALSKAIADGYDIRGYMYWSLLDNYEWDMGYHQQFGLYHVDFASEEKTRTLTDGAKYFQQVMLAEQTKRNNYFAADAGVKTAADAVEAGQAEPAA